MKSKSIVSLLTILIVIISFSVNAMAISTYNEEINNIDIRPMMMNILNSNINMVITSQGQAKIDSIIIGNKSVTRTRIIVEIQRKVNGKWVTINTWQKSSDSSSTVFTKTASVSKGYYYRSVATVTAYRGNHAETKVIPTSQMRY